MQSQQKNLQGAGLSFKEKRGINTFLVTLIGGNHLQQLQIFTEVQKPTLDNFWCRF